jgi:hypothetical protein
MAMELKGIYRSTLSKERLRDVLVEIISDGFRKQKLSSFDTIESVVASTLSRHMAIQFFDEEKCYSATATFGSVVSKLSGGVDRAIRKGRISTDEDLSRMVESILDANDSRTH